MACPKREDGSYYGLVSSLECSGHGQCINSTAYSAHFNWLCVCDSLYTGESDMFDLRVARLPDGTWLSLDCPNPRIGVYIVWSIQLLFLFSRELLILRALFSQCRYKGRMGLQRAFQYMPYRVLSFDGLVAGILLIGLPVQKLLPEGFVIGTDVGVTLCLVLGTLCGSLAYNDFEYAQFHAIVTASTMNYQLHQKLLRRQRMVLAMTCFSYCLFTLIPSVVALRLDKSLGPIQSYEFVALILRNVGIIIWMSSQWIADLFMQREIREIVRALLQVGSTNGATNVLVYLNKHASASKSTAASACIVWLFFSLPFFWPFQGYAMTIVTCFTTLRTANEGRVLLKSANIQYKQSEISAMSAANSQFTPSNLNDVKAPRMSDIPQNAGAFQTRLKTTSITGQANHPMLARASESDHHQADF